MFKYFYLLVVVCFFPSFVMADVFDDDEEDEIVISNENNRNQNLNPPQNPSRVIIYENVQSGERPRVHQMDVLGQPTTRVYGAPPSQSDRIGNERKRMEQETEQVLRNRLELLRLRDEKKRLDQLVGPMEQPNVVSSSPQSPKEVTHQSDSSFFNTKKRYITEKPYYVFLGMGQVMFTESSYTHNSYKLTNTVYALSPGIVAGLGVYEGSRISFEYSFSRSKHGWEHINQQTREKTFVMYIHNAILKYAIFPGRLKPYVGVVGSVNQMFAFVEDFPDINRYTSVFAGATAGVDLFVGSMFILNGGITYLMNTYQFKYDYYDHLPYLVEYNADNMDRFIFSATLKFMF